MGENILKLPLQSTALRLHQNYDMMTVDSVTFILCPLHTTVMYVLPFIELLP